jgi:hypothetical protein
MCSALDDNNQEDSSIIKKKSGISHSLSILMLRLQPGGSRFFIKALP